MKRITIRERGRTMLEMLGVLLVIIALTAGVLKGLQIVLGKSKIERGKEQLVTLVQRTQDFYGSRRSYMPATGNPMDFMSSLYKSNALPKGMCVEITPGVCDHLTNLFTGKVEVAPYTLPGASLPAYFSVKYNDMTVRDCTEFASMDWVIASRNTIHSIAINDGVAIPRTDMPIFPTTANEKCKTGGQAADKKSITFIFR